MLRNVDGTFAVDYDDGEHESSVLPKNIVVSEVQDEVELPFAPKLQLRLFSRILMYRCGDEAAAGGGGAGDGAGAGSAAPPMRPRKGRVLSDR